MKCNYSSHRAAFKNFASKLPAKEKKDLSEKYESILKNLSNSEEKLYAVKKLIKDTRESRTHLPLTIPKKLYTLNLPLNKNYIFPEDLKKRTYSKEERGSYYINTDAKILKAVEDIPRSVHALGIKYYQWNPLNEDEINKVLNQNLKLYPLLKYMYLTFSNKRYRGLSSIYRKYGNQDVSNILIWEEKKRYYNLQSRKNRDELRFEGYAWLLKILINYPDIDVNPDPHHDTHFDQHGRFGTPFWEIVW